jgi:redox-sensitive bicupin YhaK (pirin superfamily)
VTANSTTRRTVTRVDSKVHFGADSQVDDRNVIIAPTDPARTDPFLLLSEDWFSTRGFEWHPHRGVETVTLVLDGVLEHGDNLGNVGALTAGDVQWMTAGRGIIHRELALGNEHAHTLQLWVNLPAHLKMVDTRYQDLRAETRPVITRAGARIDVISSTLEGVTGHGLNTWPITGALVTLEPSTTYDHSLPGRDRAFFYVLSGEVEVDGRRVHAGQIAWSEPVPHTAASSITLTTRSGDAPSVVMTYSGEPIREPVAMGGPFVMTTQTEIREAVRDFNAGKFGPVPAHARLDHV